MTTHENATERFFKALGWEYKQEKISDCGEYSDYAYWHDSTGFCLGEMKLPPITIHFPSFKKYVLERMEKDRFQLKITIHFPSFKKYVLERMEEDRFQLSICTRPKKPFVLWIQMHSYPSNTFEQGIKNNEILLAAVEAATQYFEEKEDGEGS